MKLPFSLYRTLDASNAEEVRALLEEILRRRCSIVTIVKDMEHTRLETGRVAEPRKDGTIVRLTFLSDDAPHLAWSTGNYVWFIAGRKNDPVRISWAENQLTIHQNAPAGHPLCWIFAPENREELEWA